MTIFERHPVTSLDEFVFGDQETEAQIRNLLKPNCLSNALFYGPPGTGKS